MREIEYRLFDKGKYTYWSADNGDTGFWEVAMFSKNEPEQYTGLKDKNGVKIFEGDILQSIELTSPYYTVIYSIPRAGYDVTAKGTCQFTLSRVSEFMVVVGNTLGNKELIED